MIDAEVTTLFVQSGREVARATYCWIPGREGKEVRALWAEPGKAEPELVSVSEASERGLELLLAGAEQAPYMTLDELMAGAEPD